MADKSDFIQIRVTPSEKASFERAADVNGLSISAWVRERLRREARLELQSSGMKVPFLADVSLGEADT